MHTAKTEQLDFDVCEAGVPGQVRMLMGHDGSILHAFVVRRENLVFNFSVATRNPRIREVRVFSLSGDETITTVPICEHNTWAFGTLPCLTGGKRLHMYNLQPLGQDGRSLGPAVRFVVGTLDRVLDLPHEEIPMPVGLPRTIMTALR